MITYTFSIKAVFVLLRAVLANGQSTWAMDIVYQET